MTRAGRWMVLVMGTAGSAAAGAAQAPSAPEIPAAYAPPAGMCRVWLRNVPPVQQPAPTDCRTALRTRPEGSTVIYGPEARKSGISSTDWSRPLLRSARDDDRLRLGMRPSSRDAGVSSEPCVEARDARCDDPGAALPAMRSAVLWVEGQRPAELQRWFGGLNVAARFAMPSRGNSPERVQWFDGDGHLVQVWTDRNGDGRADRVEIFSRDGDRIRVIGQ